MIEFEHMCYSEYLCVCVEIVHYELVGHSDVHNEDAPLQELSLACVCIKLDMGKNKGKLSVLLVCVIYSPGI